MYPFIKTTIDKLVAIVFIVLLSPVLLVTALLIRLESKGPVLFPQLRVGHHEQTFELLKFRSMVVDNQRVVTQTMSNSDGVTRVGRWIRRLKIDELPQLFNVLGGSMSLVGPRPCLPSLLDKIDDVSRRRFTVKPGLTGLAQVNGNIYLDWPGRWRWDLKYIDELTFTNDLRILLKTALVVVLGERRFVR